MVAFQPFRPSKAKIVARSTIALLMRLLSLQRPHRFRDLHQNSPKPHTSRIRMVACRMKDKFVKGPDVQRNREGVDVEGSGTGTDEALGYDSDQIGLRDYVQSLQVVGNG